MEMPNAKNVKLTKFDTKPTVCYIKVMVFLFLQRLYIQSSIHCMMVANRLTPTSWKWGVVKKHSHNFLEVKQESRYMSADRKTVVDDQQKPMELYKQIIEAAIEDRQ